MSVEEIKTYLKQNKITYEQLAEKANIPIGTLRNLFSGRIANPGFNTMQAIYKALELSEGGEPMTAPKELIDNYERLNKMDKQKVIGYIQALLEAKKKS